MWVSDKEAKYRPIATRLLINIYDYLHDGDFIEYSKKLSIDERQYVVYHFFSRLDRFMAKMVSSGDEYSTNAAIAEDDVSKIDKASYQKAVKAIAQDFKS